MTDQAQNRTACRSPCTSVWLELQHVCMTGVIRYRTWILPDDASLHLGRPVDTVRCCMKYGDFDSVNGLRVIRWNALRWWKWCECCIKYSSQMLGQRSSETIWSQLFFRRTFAGSGWFVEARWRCPMFGRLFVVAILYVARAGRLQMRARISTSRLECSRVKIGNHRDALKASHFPADFSAFNQEIFSTPSKSANSWSCFVCLEWKG